MPLLVQDYIGVIIRHAEQVSNISGGIEQYLTTDVIPAKAFRIERDRVKKSSRHPELGSRSHETFPQTPEMLNQVQHDDFRIPAEDGMTSAEGMPLTSITELLNAIPTFLKIWCKAR